MDKKLVLKMLTSNSISGKDLNIFIFEYVKMKKSKELSVEEVKQIAEIVKFGIFNLEYALKEAAKDLNIQVITLTNEFQVIKTFAYEY